MKRRIPILLCLIAVLLTALLLCLAACGDTEQPAAPDADTTVSDTDAADTEAKPEEEDESYPEPDLPDVSYPGEDFTVMTRNNGGNGCLDIYAEAESGDTILDAVYRRNLALYDKYGITVKEVPMTDAEVNDTLYRTVAAGEAAFDMIDVDLQQCYYGASNDLLLDLNDFDYLDLSNPWWDASSNDSFSICNRLYYIIGDANIQAMQGTWALVFNKDLMRDIGYEDGYLYDLVRDGKWTLDALYNIVKGFARDENNDNMMTTVDRYGMSLNGASLFGFMLNAGVDFTPKDENDELYFANIDDRTNSILTKLSDLLSTRISYNHNNPQQNPEVETGPNTDYVPFLEGRALFFSQALMSIDSLRDMDADFGVIPHPKYSEDEDYRTFIHHYLGNGFAVPITAPDLKKTAVMMEYMSYLSSDMIVPVYYDRVLEGKYVRDADSYEMINDYIMDKRIYDIGMANDIGGFSFQLYNMFLQDVRAFASTYARSVRQMETVVEGINEVFR